MLTKRFGKIEGITDRGYITNSYPIAVFEKSAFKKVSIRSNSKIQSPGGAISYESINLQTT